MKYARLPFLFRTVPSLPSNPRSAPHTPSASYLVPILMLCLFSICAVAFSGVHCTKNSLHQELLPLPRHHSAAAHFRSTTRIAPHGVRARSSSPSSAPCVTLIGFSATITCSALPCPSTRQCSSTTYSTPLFPSLLLGHTCSTKFPFPSLPHADSLSPMTSVGLPWSRRQ
jgi:hypothetical protein